MKDFDRDGFLDIAVTLVHDAALSILLGRGDGSFASPRFIAAGNEPRDAVAADLKNDPRLDDAERCLLVEEMAEWMFPRPIRAQLQSTTECE